MGKGKRFELDTKNAINDATRGWVKAHRPDYSGSSVGEVADIMVVWQAERYDDQRPSGHSERHVAYGELKKRSGVDEGNRKVVMRGSSDGQNGLEELQELLAETPPWTTTVVGVKFPNRELIVLDAQELHDALMDGRSEDDREMHYTRLTPSGSISMVKPELHYWPSSQTGKDDHIKFLHSIGVENYDIEREHRP